MFGGKYKGHQKDDRLQSDDDSPSCSVKVIGEIRAQKTGYTADSHTEQEQTGKAISQEVGGCPGSTHHGNYQKCPYGLQSGNT